MLSEKQKNNPFYPKDVKKLQQLLKKNGLKREFKSLYGHKDFTEGVNIILKRNDVSMVGEVFKYEQDGYDEEHIIKEEAGRSQVCFDHDFHKGFKCAVTDSISIAPDLRNNGIGTALVKYQEYLARSVDAEKYYIMHADNEKFWSKMEYTKVNDRVFLKDL